MRGRTPPLYPFIHHYTHLVEEPNDLASNVLPSCLFVVHDPRRGCEDDIAELTRRQELDDPLLKFPYADVVAGGNDTSLVESTLKVLEAVLDGYPTLELTARLVE